MSAQRLALVLGLALAGTSGAARADSWTQTQSGHDAHGRPFTRVTNSTGTWTETKSGHDAHGRPFTRITNSDGSFTETTSGHDAHGRPYTVTTKHDAR